jgi:heme/copper-type cytochrome/quinol oxidase subunit 3
MKIPYALEPRPDTGFRNGRLGLWLFAASEVMLFAGLFAALVFLRAAADVWPKAALEHSLPFLNFAILMLLGTASMFAKRALGLRGPALSPGGRAGAVVDEARPVPPAELRRFTLWWAVIALLGLAFLFVLEFEWSILLGMGRTPAAHNLYAIYAALAGLHALHVVAGLVITLWMLSTAGRLAADSPARLRERVVGMTFYWEFVTVLWIAIVFGVFVL